MTSIPIYAQSMQQTDKDELHVCPYDPVHRVAAKRFIRHVLKCRKNHPGSDKVSCPFNARHIVPKPELPMHISTCLDKRMIENEINYERLQADGDEIKGDISVPPYSSEPLDFGDDEDWDEEVADENTKPNYSFKRHEISSKWRMEFDVDQHRLNETPKELRPAQTSQPFQMERRPIGHPQLRSGIVGMGRGRNVNPTNRNQTKPNSCAVPSSGLSLAPNFKVNSCEVNRLKPDSSRPGVAPKCIGRGRIPNNLPKCNGLSFAGEMIATREMDEEIQRSLESMTFNIDQANNTTDEQSMNPSFNELSSIDSQNDEQTAMKKEKRKLTKLIKQIEKLEEKLEKGDSLNGEELTKLSKKPQFEARLTEISV